MDTQFIGIYPCEYMAFDIYFSSLMSLQVHPGAGQKGNVPLTIDECKDIAIQMLIVRREIPVHINLVEGEG